MTMSYEEILEASVPRYLKNDILALEEGIKNNSLSLDCLYNEVEGSIDSAYYGREISKELAVHLRRKYLNCEY